METDYLIVGAGIAGCTLAMELHAMGAKVQLLDNETQNTSSRVAAGIVNPIIPKNITKTWECDTIFSKIPAFYHRLDTVLGRNTFTELSLRQIHASPIESNLWASQYDKLNPYLVSGSEKLPDWVLAPYGYTEIAHCGRLRVAEFCRNVKDFFVQQRAFHETHLDYSELHFTGDKWNYQSIAANAVIFCEGYAAIGNPFFNYLPFAPSSGDILELEIDQTLDLQYLYKQKYWIAPGLTGRWLAGGTFYLNNADEVPTESAKQEILAGLQKWMTPQKIHVVKHSRAVRPTVMHRRPIIGEHPKIARLYIFNGLGTKGVSLCAWLAPILANHLVCNAPLPKETDTRHIKFKPA